MWDNVKHLKLLATGGAEEVLAVGVAEHVQSQFIRSTESFITLCTLEDLLGVKTPHVFLYLHNTN